MLPPDGPVHAFHAARPLVLPVSARDLEPPLPRKIRLEDPAKIIEMAEKEARDAAGRTPGTRSRDSAGPGERLAEPDARAVSEAEDMDSQV